ncbi:hypothetical protein LOTGIDRAFT_159258 [Lottia gigantea]|uniref:Peptidase S1 domain-containing protein n=1 Tax=Lottia gigantea TaxID=225164 RepID=V4AXW8_LOTGI|nr:hypothetical protein LOTGIDRAFT_159258 [Lottia gigantea]ESO98451.1 hypothetical protein LOTGIDRAFT_159258 [Lottia gigantea]
MWMLSIVVITGLSALVYAQQFPPFPQTIAQPFAQQQIVQQLNAQQQFQSFPWQFSECSTQFGGRCSSFCYTGEQPAHPYFCFYGMAQCCIPVAKSCSSVGGTCRLSCGADTPSTDTTVVCNGQQYCCMPNNNTSTTPSTTTGSVSQRQGACGAATPLNNVQPRILNGYTGRQCEWPWMVSFRHPTKGLFCSGVLVNNDTVLTSGRCVVNAPLQEIKVHAGDFITSRPDFQESVYSVNSIDIMEGYNFQVKGKNLAAVKLASPIVFDQCKRPVCLVDKSIPLKPSTKCYIAGFGATEYGQPPALQAADVTLLDRNTCQTYIAMATGETLPSDVVCTNTQLDNTDACPGDDGGMLVCPDVNNRWSLVGIITYYSCSRLPTLYTDISTYSDWILQRL